MAESVREEAQRARRMIRLLWLIFFLVIGAVLILTLWTWWRGQQLQEIVSVWPQKLDDLERYIR